MFGSWLRRTIFWIVDILKGGFVKKHYIDIVDKMEYGKDSKDVLPDLLTYVRENVPHYSKIKESRLEFFPIVSKQDMKNYPTDFRSREYPNENKLHSVYTGGSSGVPFKAVQDNNKRCRNIADIIYCHNKIGWKLGDKYIFVRGP